MCKNWRIPAQQMAGWLNGLDDDILGLLWSVSSFPMGFDEGGRVRLMLYQTFVYLKPVSFDFRSSSNHQLLWPFGDCSCNGDLRCVPMHI
jgi:hypothetical protein